ncbi:MAG TPA: hypothetical protein VIA06_00855 [Candidatus Dormibacteraeota bacterium]|jgi:hypothetical protein|nr:hypothetical protein [Candidatus Dormibacteraeota bacterium]
MEEQPKGRRFTADGEWWWDGEQWQSVDRSAETGIVPVAPPARPIRERRSLPWFPVLVGILTVAALVGAVLLVLPHGAPAKAAPTPRPTPSVAVSPTPGGERAAAQAYAQLVTVRGAQLDASFQTVSNACGDPGQLSACKSALVTLQDQVHQFQRDLDQTPVPVCLRTADSALHQSLDLFSRGTADAIAGIDQDQPEEVSAGTQYIDQGSQQLQQVQADLGATRC